MKMMRVGLDPHWGSLINEKKLGDWSTFAVNQGFEALEFTITFRMREKGLRLIFDRKVITVLNHARNRKLRFHVLVEPFKSRMASPKTRIWHQSVWRVSEILNFLENFIHPNFVLLHPGIGSGSPDSDMKQLARSFKILQDRYPNLHLGLKLGEAGNCLKTIEDVKRITGHLQKIDLALDIGWASWAYKNNILRLQQLFRVMGKHLYQVNWHNFTSEPPLFHLPLSRGELGERDYYKFLSYLPRPERIWHILDYRDRSRNHYSSDKLMLEDLDFRRA